MIAKEANFFSDQNLNDDESQSVLLNVDVNPIELSYASFRGNVSLSIEVLIENDTDTPLKGCQLVVKTYTSLLSELDRQIPVSTTIRDCSSASNTYKTRIKCKINPELFRGLSEDELQTITISLIDPVKNLTLQSKDLSLTIKPANYWTGDPKTLAVFIQRNNDAISKLASSVGEVLKQYCGSSALCGYQKNDPKHVRQQCAAIYAVLQKQEVLYSEPIVSDEFQGQRIRSASEILSEKTATCLDLALLYCSLAEHIGLHPIVCLVPQHAFPGVLLDEKRSLDHVVFDDPSIISQDAGNHICVVESTSFTKDTSIDFNQACALALQKAQQAEQMQIIDVHFARLSQILPLPERKLDENGVPVYVEDCGFDIEGNQASHDESVAEIDLTKKEIADNTPKGRFEQWQRKLLDFSYRNPLMNMRMGGSFIQILCPNVGEFENTLSSGASFSLSADDSATEPKADLSEAAIAANRDDQALRSLLQHNIMRTSETEASLKRKLGSIYRKTQKNLSESGVYTLYLTLGHIEYYEKEQAYRAPVLLYPIELIRKNGEYTLQMRDDEDPQLNFSVFEKFRNDLQYETRLSYQNLPTDESGLNITEIFAILRTELKEIPRWKLIESCSLGIYSFDQFVMYNDLKGHSDALLENKIIKSLVNRELAFQQPDLSKVEDIDFIKQTVPVPCDESQLKAVKAAAEGYSFILQGPPGTGKSQTITSIIVNAMAHGKKVLFVAEKMAALQVVYRNLHKVGVSSHLLELHSVKATRAHFLEQLSAALEQSEETVPDNKDAEERIEGVSNELHAYIHELHSRRSCGESLYQLIDSYIRHRNVPITQIPFSDIETVQREDLEGCNSHLQEYSTNLKRFRPLAASPFQGLHFTAYDDETRTEVVGLSRQLKTLLEKASGMRNVLAGHMRGSGFILSSVSGDELVVLNDLIEKLKNDDLPKQFLSIESSSLRDGLSALEHYFKLKSDTDTSRGWSPEIFQESIPGLIQQWDSVKKGFFKGKQRAALISKVNSMAPSGIVVTEQNIVEELKKLNSLISDLRKLQQEELKIPENIRFLCTKNLTIAQKVVKDVSLYRQETANVLKKLGYASTGGEYLQIALDWFESTDFTNELHTFSDIQKDIHTCLDALCALLKADRTISALPYSELDMRCECWMMQNNDMSAWAHCNDLGSWFDDKPYAKPFVQKLLEGNDVQDISLQLVASWEKSYIDEIFQTSSLLFRYEQSGFDERIQMLMQAEEEYRNHVKKSLPMILSKQIPEDGQAGRPLQRYVATKGKKQSVRQFLAKYLHEVLAYFPCFLMSPMSVAQYLDPEIHPFDLVVFDEASQIPTCKAVGPIARGRNLIVVGDTKQMPPTSFFQKGSSVDEDSDDLYADDLDSILADCIDILPQTSLNWHYRSANESLIAFSNSHYYHNGLKTYPSVDSLHSKVSLHHVIGYYQAGNKEPNPAEADAIVKEIRKRLEDPKTQNESIGVITFGEKQQNLIQDKLDELFARKRKLAKLAKWDQSEIDCPDRLIVKNLENIQGDERDVILLSVTYGKTKAGRFSTNFGPVSSVGGENRLNVAFSRAKKEMVVFTIIDLGEFSSKQIPSKGGNDLKSFLQFASQSNNALLPSKRQDQQVQMTREILQMLETHGYEGILNIGLSDFRVDIALKNPKRPDTFFCGILLDGESMKLSSLSNDRFILRANLLKARGWNIILVRTIDWFNSPEQESAYILDQVEKYKDNLTDVQQGLDATLESPIDSPTADGSRIGLDYQAYEFEVVDKITPDEFLDLPETQLIPRYKDVIEGEGPILEDLLEQRVLKSFGLKRRGQNIKPILDNALLHGNFVATQQVDLEGHPQRIYWPEKWRNVGGIESTYKQFRRNREDASAEGKRQVFEIPQVEILNAFLSTIESNGSTMENELVRKTVESLGFKSKGANILGIMGMVLRNGISAKRLRKDELGRIDIVPTIGRPQDADEMENPLNAENSKIPLEKNELSNEIVEKV